MKNIIKNLLTKNLSEKTVERIDMAIGMIIVAKDSIKKKTINPVKGVRKEIINGELVTIIDVKYKNVA